MRKLSQKQLDLLAIVKQNEGFNTHQLAKIALPRLGKTPGIYEVNILNRLFTLELKGLIFSKERLSAKHRGRVIERKWYAI